MGVVMLAGSLRPERHRRSPESGCGSVSRKFSAWWCFWWPGSPKTRRLPFDLPEAESELVAGYHAEYSGMKFGMFFVGEYIGITLMSAMLVTLFFGGLARAGAAGDRVVRH